MVHRVLCALITVALLAGCAGIPQRSDSRPIPPDRFQAYAGEPIHSFNYFGRFDGWRPLGQQQLAVWTSAGDGYLLTVEPPCLDLEYATAIGFSTQVSHIVTSGLDFVRMNRERCRILEIRPLDYGGLTAEREGPR